ncbi:MAG: nucleotide-binding protein, partial [Chitinophagaceae bacterium]|nr:nucleotide-binding protein [Chitinophagaceae bacterium]
MPDDLTVPKQGDEQTPDYISPMLELINSALASIQTQDLQEATVILQKGKSLYKKATSAYAEDPFQLKIMEMCLSNIHACYTVVKAAYSKLEEKFEQTRKEFDDAIAICNQGILLTTELEQFDEEDWKPAISIYKFLFYFICFLSEAEAVEIDHEIHIQRGQYSDYAAVLRESARLYRQINEVEIDPDDENPTIPALIKMLNRFADIKENKAERAKNSSAVLKHLPVRGKKIFLIHGHGEAQLLELEKLLEERFKLQCVILKHEGNLGESVIEKFEKHAGECGYAFAILTPDDVIKKGDADYFQARPNVLFEMGWFYGRYGRKNLCILKQKQVVMPSDLGGIICLEFDKKIGEVYLEL